MSTYEPSWRYLGWCPNTPTIRMAPAVNLTPVSTTSKVQPDGGAGGSGRIGRGTGIVGESIRILKQNRQLFAFSVLTGLVILFVFCTELSLMFLSGAYTYWVLGFEAGLALTFAIELISVFSLYCILAALIMSIPRRSPVGGTAPFREGLSRMGNHLPLIAGWSVVMAFCGTALLTIIVHNPYFSIVYPALVTTTLSIPFTYYIPGMVIAALTFTFITMLINVFLFILVPFVVPALVLENKGLPGAVAGSLALSKKVWGELLTCLIIAGLIVLVLSFPDAVIRMTPALVGYNYHFFSVHGSEMAIICILYLLALWSLVVIGSTVTGIAITRFYWYGKAGIVPPPKGEKPGRRAPV